MHVAREQGYAGQPAAAQAHQWVGAALVGLGRGDNRRAEHAARTGRHVLSQATRVEVLEVYCARCRLAYSERACRFECTGLAVRAG